MKPHEREEKNVKIDYDCDLKDTTGCTGVMYNSNPAKNENEKYDHTCPECGYECELDRIYPYEELRFVDV